MSNLKNGQFTVDELIIIKLKAEEKLEGILVAAETSLGEELSKQMDPFISNKLVKLQKSPVDVCDNIRYFKSRGGRQDILGILIANLHREDFNLHELKNIKSALSVKGYYSLSGWGTLHLQLVDDMAEMKAFRSAGITDDEMQKAMMDASHGTWYPSLSSDPTSFVIFVKDTDGVRNYEFPIYEFKERIRQFQEQEYRHADLKTPIGDKFSLPETLDRKMKDEIKKFLENH